MLWYIHRNKKCDKVHAMRASFDVWKMTTLGRVASSGCIGVGFLYNSSMYYCIGEKGVIQKTKLFAEQHGWYFSSCPQFAGSKSEPLNNVCILSENKSIQHKTNTSEAKVGYRVIHLSIF